jgi:hypothetical protein
MKKTFLNMVIVFALLSVSLFVIHSPFAAGVVDNTAAQSIAIGIVNQDPDPAVAGDTFDVRLSIENDGSMSTNNIMLEVVPTYPFEEVPGESLIQNLGPLTAYQSGANVQISKYTLKTNKDATQGTHYLTVKYYVEGNENNSITKLIPINVRTSQSVEIIHIDRTVLIPGQQSSMKFVINNVGNAPLKDLTFSWSNSVQAILPVGSDNTRYIPNLDVGGSAEIEYQVLADTTVTAGLYPLNLVLKYSGSSGNTTTISTVAGVYIGGGTDFDVAFSDSTSGTTSFTIANVGSNPATSVSVSIPNQRAWRTTGSNSMIIGNLNKGDYTVASFKLQSLASTLGNRTGGRNMTNYAGNPSSATPSTTPSDGSANSASANFNGASGTNNLIMQIKYTDTMGIRTVVNKTINIGAQASAGNQTSSGAYGSRGGAASTPKIPSYTWYIIGAVVLVAGFFVYRRYKKQKLLNSNANIKDVFKTKKK